MSDQKKDRRTDLQLLEELNKLPEGLPESERRRIYQLTAQRNYTNWLNSVRAPYGTGA